MAYIKIVFLIVYYMALLCLCITCSSRIAFTPEFCFIGCFLPQLVYALFYVERWNFDISVETICVYFIGATVFVISSLLCRGCLTNNKGTSTFKGQNSTSNKIELSKAFLIFFVLFQMVSFIIVSKAIIQITSRPNLMEAVDMYGFLSKESGIEMPSLSGKMNLLCYTSSFLWAYYLIHSYVFKYKTCRLLLTINLLLSVVHHMITGSRGGVVELIVASVYFWYLFRGEAKKWENVVTLRTVLIGIAFAMLGLVLFRFSLDLLGRTATAGEMLGDYVARYLSAPMKNIDIKISSGVSGFRDVTEWETINSALSFFSRVFGFKYSKVLGDASTYMSVNGFGLGNVYTIYYPMIQDLDIWGPVLFIIPIAVICQCVFLRALKPSITHNKHIQLNMFIVVYGYILSKLIFSFFSNRFYSSILSTGMVWCLICLWIVKIGAESRLKTRTIYLTDRVCLKF